MRDQVLSVCQIAESKRRAESLLSIVVPVYNEARTVSDVLRRLADLPCDKQILVVDDGSNDESVGLIRQWLDDAGIELILHPENRGKGAAIRAALQRATGRYTVIQDADLEYDPADLRRLVEHLRGGEGDVIYGSRYLPSADWPRPPRRLLGAGVALLNLAVRLLYGARLTDEATCYKVFPTRVLRQMDLQCRGFEFCAEVTAKACRMGLRILEVPIRYHPRRASEGKKLRWRDGLTALRELWKWRRWQPPLPMSSQPSGRRGGVAGVESAKPRNRGA